MNGTLMGPSVNGVAAPASFSVSRWPARRMFLLAVVATAAASAIFLHLTPAGLAPGRGGLILASKFFAAALTPAFDYEESVGLPAGAPAFLGQVIRAALETVRIAAAAVSLSIVAGLLLGFLGSSAWWPERARVWPRLLWFSARGMMTLFRSIHELIWAIVFLAAFGLTPLTAVLAIAIPYSGTLAKVFSEMCEESPPETKAAFRTLGASPLQFYFLGLTPRVMAELISYSLYRFECGLRSAAVLGFLGVPTLGYHLKLAFENSHNHEVWTYLYALLLLVIVFDQWSGAMRQRLSGYAGPVMAPPTMASRPRDGSADVETRRKAKETPIPTGGSSESGLALPRAPREFYVRGSFWVIVVIVLWAWLTGGFGLEESQSARRLTNIQRFFEEIRPWPLQQGNGDVRAVIGWAQSLLVNHGVRAALNTLAMSIVAIVFAAALAWVILPFAARNLASPDPFLPSSMKSRPGRRWLWRGVVGASRFGLIFTRAVPEYIWAFLFVAMVSDQFWAAILALGIHNAGILGRLGAEIVENADAVVPRGLRALGATRGQVLGFGLFPLGFPRFLVYFFYRWETCLREGTVLGLLGVATLGRLVKDTRAMDRYDEMIFYVLLGAALVFIGDLFSALARRWVRV
jgi:phosphonate transport system permease protein